MSRTDENMISIYKRKILKFIFGEVQENGTWRSNFELYHSYKESDIINFIKIQRIKRAAHFVRMDADRTTKSLQCPTNWHTEKDRPNVRWIDGLEKYLLVLRTEKLVTTSTK
ncbi:uncharacterized protein TNCV_4390651 [Trichonephila clavipes]|nr:uncharacterized protein TNCV_4390651 [Trichonephila clavipes]